MKFCDCSFGCTGIAVIVSAILGVVAGVLRYTGQIVATPAFLWVLFGIAVVYLAVNLVTARFGKGCKNECALIRTLVLSILATVLLSVVLLGITFAATSVLGAILTGALISAFSMTLATTACLIPCLKNCD